MLVRLAGVHGGEGRDGIVVVDLAGGLGVSTTDSTSAFSNCPCCAHISGLPPVASFAFMFAPASPPRTAFIRPLAAPQCSGFSPSPPCLRPAAAPASSSPPPAPYLHRVTILLRILPIISSPPTSTLVGTPPHRGLPATGCIPAAPWRRSERNPMLRRCWAHACAS